MSNKPEIYAFCKAGCKWPTVHKEDLERAATFINHNIAYGMEKGKRYLIKSSDVTTWNFQLLFRYYEINKFEGITTQLDLPIELPTFDKYKPEIIFELLDVTMSTQIIKYVYEINGVRYSGELSAVLDFDTSKGFMAYVEHNQLGNVEVYLFNSNAQILLAPEKVFIKYADDENGLHMTDKYSGQAYMGTYVGETISTNPSDYTWVLLVEKHYLNVGDNLKGKTIKFNVNNTLTADDANKITIGVDEDYYIGICNNLDLGLYDSNNDECVVQFCDNNGNWLMNAYTFDMDLHINSFDDIANVNKYISYDTYNELIEKVEVLESEIKVLETKADKSTVKALDHRVTNIESALTGSVMDEVIDESVSRIKNVPSGALPYAYINSIGGRSLNINQLAKKLGNWYMSGGTLTNNVFTAKTQYGGPYITTTKFIANRKYYIYARIKLTTATNAIYFGIGNASGITPSNIIITKSTTEWQTLTKIVTYIKTGDESQNNKVFFLDTRSSGWDAITIEDSVMVIDLTAMYGVGNEPTDVNKVLEDIEQFKVNGYLPYNVGTTNNLKVTEIKSVGVNLIPNTWLNGYWFNTNTGENVTLSDYKKRKISDFIKVTNGDYYLGVFNDNIPTTGEYDIWYVTYDNNKNFLGTFLAAPNKVISLNNVSYVRIGIISLSYDGILNISNDAINGTYYPYKETILKLPSVDLQTFDTLDLENKKHYENSYLVDLGTLNWAYTSTEGQLRFTSTDLIDLIKKPNENTILGNIICSKYATDTYVNIYNNVTDKTIAININGAIGIYDTAYTDVTTFKQAISGVMLYYELATPIETDITIDEPFIEVEPNGTIDFGVSVPSKVTFNTEVE